MYGYLKNYAALSSVKSNNPRIEFNEALKRLYNKMRTVHDPLSWVIDVEKRIDKLRLGTMNKLEQVLRLLEARKNRVLTYAQIGLPEQQFRAFRKAFLDEFGKSGLESELEQLFCHSITSKKDR